MRAVEKIVLILLVFAVSVAIVCYTLFVWQGMKSISENNIPSVAEKTYAQVLLVGDMMFDRGIRYFAQKNNLPGQGDDNFIFNKISQELRSYDLVVANLEGPITNNKSISYGTVPGVSDNFFLPLTQVGHKLSLTKK